MARTGGFFKPEALQSYFMKGFQMEPERYPFNFNDACHIRHALDELGWPIERAALRFELAPAVVSKIKNRLIYPEAYPLPFSNSAAA